jgi:tetratricopeptide (TPR) repeat protein
VTALRALLASLLLIATAAPATAAESDPLPVPVGGPRAQAVELYNQGVVHLVARRFAQAQQRFEAALRLDDTLAEGHNNLAFALRMQGRHNFAASLAHYNRALALKPDLAQAYMYRGALFLQQGDRAAAQRDLERLRTLDTKLAADLERLFAGADPGQDRSGISGQYD